MVTGQQTPTFKKKQTGWNKWAQGAMTSVKIQIFLGSSRWSKIISTEVCSVFLNSHLYLINKHTAKIYNHASDKTCWHLDSWPVVHGTGLEVGQDKNASASSFRVKTLNKYNINWKLDKKYLKCNSNCFVVSVYLSICFYTTKIPCIPSISLYSA